MCTCDNGVTKCCEGCPIRGSPKCKLCNIGWTINQDSTECISTFEQPMPLVLRPRVNGRAWICTRNKSTCLYGNYSGFVGSNCLILKCGHIDRCTFAMRKLSVRLLLPGTLVHLFVLFRRYRHFHSLNAKLGDQVPANVTAQFPSKR